MSIMIAGVNFLNHLLPNLIGNIFADSKCLLKLLRIQMAALILVKEIIRFPQLVVIEQYIFIERSGYELGVVYLAGLVLIVLLKYLLHRLLRQCTLDVTVGHLELLKADHAILICVEFVE